MNKDFPTHFRSWDTQPYVSALKTQLDYLFQGCLLKNNPLIVPKKFIGMDTSMENARELYYLKGEENYVLRPDHTRTLATGIKPYFLKNLSTHCFGLVFRKGPLGPLRWRQFWQYDVDYLWDDVRLRPLIKWLNYTKPFLTKVNDTHLYKNYRHLKKSEYESKFYELYPELKRDNVILDPDFGRGWNYYDGLIYQTYAERSFAGGGLYYINDKKYLGLGIGIGRMIKTLETKNLLKDYVKPNLLVLIYNKAQSLPERLLDCFERNRIPYIIKTATTSLIKDRNLLRESLKALNYDIKATVITGSEQVKTNLFNYKTVGRQYKNQTPEQLTELFL